MELILTLRVRAIGVWTRCQPCDFSPKTCGAIACAARYYGGYGCRLDTVYGLNPTSYVRLGLRIELGVDNRVQYTFFYLIEIEFSS